MRGKPHRSVSAGRAAVSVLHRAFCIERYQGDCFHLEIDCVCKPLVSSMHRRRFRLTITQSCPTYTRLLRGTLSHRQTYRRASGVICRSGSARPMWRRERQPQTHFRMIWRLWGGDGWQCYIADPSQALPRVLHFWTCLCARGLRSRFAVAVDTVDFVSDENLSESDGAAFRQSGRALDTLDDDCWAVCVLPKSESITSSLAVKSLFELMDLLLHKWTEAQARAVAGMLRGVGTERSVTQQAVADGWSPEPITRQSVNRHLQRANWSRVERTASTFRQLIDVIADDT